MIGLYGTPSSESSRISNLEMPVLFFQKMILVTHNLSHNQKKRLAQDYK